MKIGIASGDWIAPGRIDEHEHWGGAGWARLGKYIPYFSHDVVNGVLTWNGSHFQIKDNYENQVDPDVIILQRLMHDTLADHIKKAKAVGQIIINEVDDWYWGLSPSNVAWASSNPRDNKKENINHYKSIIVASSLIVVSTPYLYERITAWQPHCPVVILPNTVDVKAFTPVVHTDRTPVVGWVGSTMHRSGDVELLRGVLPPLVKDGSISLYHGGAGGLISFASLLGMDDDSVATAPLCDASDYPNLLTMDIGVAPLRDTPFNHAKSEIKLMEYSAAGIPWVATKISSYQRFADTMGMGRLAKNGKQWISHIKALSDVNVRIEEGNRLRELIWMYDLPNGAMVWNNLIDTIFS